MGLAQARGRQSALMSRLMHERRTDAGLGRLLEHGAPARGGAGTVAVLLVGETEKIARLGLVRIAFHGGFKNVLGFIGHDAVGGGDQGLAERNVAPGR